LTGNPRGSHHRATCRRRDESEGTIAAGRQDPIETEAQRGAVARQGHIDGLPSELVGLAIEERLLNGGVGTRIEMA
jgi:hypothetical protein